MQSDTMSKHFNGYANYETWAVCLWLSNDEATCCYWTEALEAAKANAADCWQVKEQVWTAEKAPVFLLADRLKEELMDEAPELGSGLYSDLLNAALSEIDWHEVAGSFVDEDAEDPEPEGTQFSFRR